MKIPRVLAEALLAALAVFQAVALPTPTNARWFDYPHSGYCRVGTCNKLGGWRALYIRNCSAANCRR
ncbi:MAG: hypothetical protein ABSE22_13410 [Xanthobacteraceae bacterium]|jgi:hypothetical protein